jgi:nitric oxide dioxygenase
MTDRVRRQQQYSVSSDPGGDVRRSTVKRVAGTFDAREGRWPGA